MIEMFLLEITLHLVLTLVSLSAAVGIVLLLVEVKDWLKCHLIYEIKWWWHNRKEQKKNHQ